MGMMWRMVKWGTAALGVYYVWQNVVRPEMERARLPEPSTSAGVSTPPDVAPT